MTMPFDAVWTFGDWFANNYKWLLDGILVTVPVAIIGWLFFRQRASRTLNQRQQGGHGSTNVQIGTIEGKQDGQSPRAKPKSRR